MVKEELSKCLETHIGPCHVAVLSIWGAISVSTSLFIAPVGQRVRGRKQVIGLGKTYIRVPAQAWAIEEVNIQQALTLQHLFLCTIPSQTLANIILKNCPE